MCRFLHDLPVRRMHAYARVIMVMNVCTKTNDVIKYRRGSDEQQQKKEIVKE